MGLAFKNKAIGKFKFNGLLDGPDNFTERFQYDRISSNYFKEYYKVKIIMPNQIVTAVKV